MVSKSTSTRQADNRARADRPEPFLALIPAVLAFVAGMWLLLAPFVIDYRYTGDGFDAHTNDVVVGIAIVLVASLRMISPPTTAPWSYVNIALGAWLVAAPFVLGYHQGTDAREATLNDVLVGVLVALLAFTSLRLTRRAQASAERRGR